MVNPLIYRITCSSLVHLLSLPLDITSTTLLTNEAYIFQIKLVFTAVEIPAQMCKVRHFKHQFIAIISCETQAGTEVF